MNDKNLFMKRKMYFARFSKAKHKDKRKSQHGYMDIFAKNYWYYWFFKHMHAKVVRIITVSEITYNSLEQFIGRIIL